MVGARPATCRCHPSGGVTGLGVLRRLPGRASGLCVSDGLTDPIRHSRWYRALPGVR